jgi:CheY-like chemotaxis protein
MQQRILVIEDNPADAAIIHIYFEETAFGHTIYQADSLKRGFEILREHSIDLVLLDLTLTDSFGFNTVEKFLAEFPHIPVIVLTGLNNEILGVQCVRAGAQDFLVKGEFDSRALVKSIRHAQQRFQTQTKLQESAQKLSQQQKRLQEAQELANFANWEMDVVTNTMKWGEEMYRILGLPQTDAALSLGDYLQFVFFDDKDAVESFFTTALQAEEIQKIEHRIVVGTRVKHLSLRAKVQLDQDSGQVLLIGSAQDVSEQMTPILSSGSSRGITELWRKEILTELKEQIQKPLFDALDLAHLLQKTATPFQQELLPEFRSGLHEIIQAVDTLLMAQTDIRNAASQESVPFASTAFFANFLELADILASKSGCNVHLSIPPDFPKTIHGNESALLMLLNSFFKGSYAEKGRSGTIVIQVNMVKTAKDQHSMQIGYLPNDKHISAEMLKAVLDSADFSMVATPDLRRKATNLAVAGQLLKALNGKYTIRKDEKGLCELIELTIPIKAPETNTALESGAQSDLPAAQQILLVDDMPLHRLATRKVVTNLMPDAHVELANDGKGAVASVGQHRFDLILLDLQMPDMNGFDTLAALEKHNQAPVIAVTSAPSNEEKDLCLDKGFRGYVSKPIQPDALSSEIRRIIQTSK